MPGKGTIIWLQTVRILCQLEGTRVEGVEVMRHGSLFSILKILVVFSVLSLLLGTPGLASAEEATEVKVWPASQRVDPGEQFIVSIVVEPGVEIAGMQFDMTFDQSCAIVNSVEEGNLLTQGGASTYFNPGEIDNVAGAITGVYGAIISPGETVSASGTFATITLTAGMEGGTCPLNLSGVIVGDINGNAVSVSVVDGTVSVNSPPVLNPIGDKAVNEGELLTFSISAIDPDSGTLTYSASNLPLGASFDPVTRTFYWTPNYAQAGFYTNVRFEVSDGSLSDFEEITITVNQPYDDWDTNTDGAVNVLDMIRVGQHWGEVGLEGWIREDVNEDGAVNVLDMILIGQHWTG
jgi:hypothetical protein